MTLAVIAVYMALVLAVGALSHRRFRGTGEDYFLATRSIGPFVLLMSLFGTQMTAYPCSVRRGSRIAPASGSSA